MLANNMLSLALASVATLVVAAHPEHQKPTATPSWGEEGHTRAFSMAATPTGMVPHYIGNGVVGHMMPHDAEALNITWLDRDTGKNITKRDRSNCNTLECDAGVYICSKENYKGSCYWQRAGGKQCHPYPYTRASSFGIDMGLQCALFQENNCLYNQYTALTWPGLSNLYGTPTWWNAKPLSFKCRPCVGCIYNKAPEWVINFSTD
jgi:hypothetical protein